MQRKVSFFCCPWVLLLHDRGVHKARVGMEDRLGESRRSGGKIDRAVVRIRHDHTGGNTGVIRRLGDEILREGRASGSDVEKESSAGDAVRDLLDTADELRSEDQDVRFRELDAVFDLIRAVAEVQRHRDRARLQNTEIDRKPVQAVHEKDRDLVALDDPSRDQHVGHAIGLLIKNSPCDLTAARDLVKGLDQFKFFPGRKSRDLDIGVQFDQSHVIGPLRRVAFQKLCDRHGFPSLKVQRFKV